MLNIQKIKVNNVHLITRLGVRKKVMNYNYVISDKICAKNNFEMSKKRL